jgi:uncharacterized repeat protein (TIGR03806 family)
MPFVRGLRCTLRCTLVVWVVACAPPTDPKRAADPPTTTVPTTTATPTGVSGVDLQPELPVSDDTLRCTAEGAVSEWWWWTDGVGPALGGPTFEGLLAPGVEVQCGALGADGGVVLSQARVVQNRPPPAPVVSLLDVPDGAATDAHCDITVAPDPDGEPLTLAVSWTLDGVMSDAVLTTTHPGDTLAASALRSGQALTCAVVVDDGHGPVGPVVASAWVGEVLHPVGLDVRPTNHTCVAPDPPPAWAEVVPVPANHVRLTEAPHDRPQQMVPSPDGSWWYVALQQGYVVRFENTPDAASFEEVLDISDQTMAWYNDQCGLMGLVLDPLFEVNGHMYLSYTLEPFDGRHGMVSRLSRVTSFDGGATFEPWTEVVLLESARLGYLHSGGRMAFLEDGSLMMALGDGGDSNEADGRAQDPFSLFGSLLRIVPQDDGSYTVPPDNPWSDGIEGRPEVWAMGLRNPWQWDVDPKTGAVWVGDVGAQTWEEVSYVEPGDNLGWPVAEGAGCYRAPCDLTGLTAPVFEYVHDGPAAIIGGRVYKGLDNPAIQGWFLFGEHHAGWLRGARRTESGDFEVRLLHEGHGVKVASMAEDQLGEIWMLERSEGRFWRLETAPPAAPDTFPERLSATGCVDELDPSLPAEGLIGFEPSAKLWSDGADKERWLALPEGERIAVADDGALTFPKGTVLMKHFRIDGALAETRLLMRHQDGRWAGYSYAWDEDGSDAVLLDASEQRSWGGQEWTYPSRSQCMTCHTSPSNRVLGAEPAQLTGPVSWPDGRVAIQLDTWTHIGLFEEPVPPPDPLPDPHDTSQPLHLRAAAYLHVNCAGCHQPGGGGVGLMDLRWGVDPNHFCDARADVDLGIEDARVVAPGEPERSTLSVRMHSLDPHHRMPPLGTTLVDPDGTALIDQWITETRCD